MMSLRKHITGLFLRTFKTPKSISIRHKSTGGQLIVRPQLSLVDSPLSVLGVNLPPNTPVTLTTRLTSKNDNFNFSSVCRYKTCELGTIDISQQAPLDGGSYDGIHAMGPFWSVKPEENSSKRLWPRDITTSFDYSLSLTDEGGDILASAQVKRSFVGEGVERIEFKEGRVRGTLFLPPPHLRPSPAIITIYGGLNRGTAPEDRAAMFASHGFASLALAFFGVDDLPKAYKALDIEYFEEAVDSLLRHSDVLGDAVGLWGLSQGGNISLGMMAFLGQKIKSAVVVGSNFGIGPSEEFQIVYKDEVIKNQEAYIELDKGVLYLLGPVEEHLHDPSRQINFERSSADLLVISGDDDPCSGGPLDQIYARTNLERARVSGKTNCTLLTYPGLGHLVDLPYAPFCDAASNPLLPPGFIFFYGGSRQPHALAQIDAWDKTIHFYKTTLFQ